MDLKFRAYFISGKSLKNFKSLIRSCELDDKFKAFVEVEEEDLIILSGVDFRYLLAAAHGEIE